MLVVIMRPGWNAAGHNAQSVSSVTPGTSNGAVDTYIFDMSLILLFAAGLAQPRRWTTFALPGRG